jgi:hypothetical protein
MASCTAREATRAACSAEGTGGGDGEAGVGDRATAGRDGGGAPTDAGPSTRVTTATGADAAVARVDGAPPPAAGASASPVVASAPSASAAAASAGAPGDGVLGANDLLMNPYRTAGGMVAQDGAASRANVAMAETKGPMSAARGPESVSRGPLAAKA